MKSRLVARGDLSHVFNRSDAPTADKEAVFMVLSFASSRGLTIKSGDLDHGYFQGEKLSNPLVLRQPTGGLPAPGIKPDDRLLAFVHIYGTRDAGLSLWRKIRRVLLSRGFTENFVLNALYAFTRDGVVQVLLATHVDDTIWANEPEVDFIMDEIRKELVFGTEEQLKFRFCGIEVDQDPQTYTIRVSCEQTSKKLSLIRLSRERSKQLEAPATEDEREQLMNVTGSLMWISRSCRPGISYSV